MNGGCACLTRARNNLQAKLMRHRHTWPMGASGNDSPPLEMRLRRRERGRVSDCESLRNNVIVWSLKSLAEFEGKLRSRGYLRAAGKGQGMDIRAAPLIRTSARPTNHAFELCPARPSTVVRKCPQVGRAVLTCTCVSRVLGACMRAADHDKERSSKLESNINRQ